jgi:zinc protease
MIKLALTLAVTAFSQQLSEPRETKLSNGLSVVMAEDHSSPLVSVVWGAHVGASAEPLDFQGNSHYLEHLLLSRGTKHYPPGRIGELVSGRGGYFNGFTWDDYTGYVLQATKEKLDELLDMHEDMMFSATFGGEEFETEKKAVQQEYRLRMDKPDYYIFDTAGYHMYPGETFYSRGTIGTLETVQAATVEGVRKYYESYYVPNNITLVVVGDFDAATLLPKLEARFGKYPRKPVAKPPYRALPLKPGVNVVETERDAGKSYLMLGFPAPQAVSPDYFPLELLASYLSNGNTALLRDELVTKRKLLDDVDMTNLPRRFPGGWIPVEAQASPEKAAAGVEALLELLGKVAREGVPEAQLDLARRRLVNAHAAVKENQLAVAQALVKKACIGDYRLFTEYEKRLSEVTPRDVLWVARKYLASPNFYVSAVHPKGASPKDFAARARAAAAKLAVDEAPVSSKTLPNGSVLLHEPRVGSPMEGFTLAVRAGSRYDGDKPGLAASVAELLTRQTAARDRFALRKYLDENGFLLSGSAGRDGAYLTLQAPAGKTRQALALLRELVEKPALGAADWALVQKEFVERARALKDQPDWVADSSTYELLFPGGPYATPPEGRPESLEKIAPADLQAFMKQRWSLDRAALAYVGPAEPAVVAEEWAKASRPKPAKAPAEKASVLAAAPSARKAVDMPGKLTSYLVLAWPAPAFGTPEWVRYVLANQAFGGDIAGRLFQLRQKEGLAYSVWARSAGLRDQPLAFVTMGTALANRDKALAALDRELGKLASASFSAEDVERVKTSYLGAIDRQDSTAMARANRLGSWWLAGAPADYRAKLRKMVAEADAASVNAAAASVLKAGGYRLVIAGQQTAP